MLNGVQRHAECQLFIEQRGWQGVPWVAIDDKPLLFSPDAPLIETDYRTGLQEAKIDRFLQGIERSESGPNTLHIDTPRGNP